MRPIDHKKFWGILIPVALAVGLLLWKVPAIMDGVISRTIFGGLLFAFICWLRFYAVK
ncbi:MAG: hypothetical protein ACOX41_07940 [Anaerovoracaceae bacterium]|jgi:hypothetical protein